MADAVDANAMAVLHGDAGLGKAFAVEDALAAPRLPLLCVLFPSRPTPRLIATTLLEALTGCPLLLHLSAWHLWLEHNDHDASSSGGS